VTAIARFALMEFATPEDANNAVEQFHNKEFRQVFDREYCPTTE